MTSGNCLNIFGAIRLPLLALALMALFAVLVLALSAVHLAHAQEPDTVAPKFVSARTDSDGAYVIVTFSEDIFLSPVVRYAIEKLQIKPYQFPKAVMDVTVDGHNDVLTDYVFISGSELWMSLSAHVSSGQEVKVAYDNIFAQSGGGIFVDASGNAAPYFSFQPVKNNSTLSGDIDRTPDYALSVSELTIPEGGSATYTVVLVSQPTQDVHVRVSPFKTLVTSVDIVPFTPDNWDTPQTVTVSTYEDDDPFDAWGVVHHYLEWDEDGYSVTNEDYWVGIDVVVDDGDLPLPVTGNILNAFQEGGATSVASYTASGAGDSTVTWSLLGEDSDDFSISDSGVLSFNSPPDYDSPSDSEADNVYELFVEASTDSSLGFLPVVVIVIERSNTPATGAPTITGTAQVGQTLTADTSGISDADGLDNVSYSYQWISNDGTTDTDIDGATSSTYEVQSSDNGKVIKVRVTFTDDAGSDESLTSAGTSAVVMGWL